MNDAPFRIANRAATAIPLFERDIKEAGWRRVMSALRQRASDLRFQFLIIVIAPTVLSAIYFGLVASKRYVSHAEYIVRSVNSHRSGGLGAILSTFGISRTADDTSIIENFIRSRDAIRQLDERLNLREIYGRPEADLLSRFPWPFESDTFERLYTRTQNYITVTEDSTTGITTLEVSAFRPGDAKGIATVLIALAEETANRMNDRVEADAIKQSKEELEKAREDVLKAQADLTSFRNSEYMVDPVSYAGMLLNGISKLSLDQAQTQAEIKQTENLSPSNPAIPSLLAKAEALGNKITEERKKLAGNNMALAGKVSEYDRLNLMKELADKNYASALNATLQAEEDAQRRQIYIEQMVAPNLPDDDTEPRRLRVILTVFVLAFATFSMVWILTVGAKDHAQ
jgi:capsular polysaccharide transport system permease protein